MSGHNQNTGITTTQEKFFTPIELARRWKMSVNTLNNWRSAKTRKGPGYIKFANAVLYSVADIEAFEQAHRISVGSNSADLGEGKK